MILINKKGEYIEMEIVIINIKRDRQHFKVTMGDEFYCTADTLKEALTEAEALEQLLKAVSTDAEIAIDVKC